MGVMLTGSEPSSLGYDYVRDFLLSDPTWQWQDMNYSIIECADQRDPGDLNATKLQYHGIPRSWREVVTIPWIL
jgi:hypothetical protein